MAVLLGKTPTDILHLVLFQTQAMADKIENLKIKTISRFINLERHLYQPGTNISNGVEAFWILVSGFRSK